MDKVKFQKTKAHQRYLLEGNPVPGVTTVLGMLNKPALLYWAWDLGQKGIDYRKAKDAAADVGTITHWLIECHLKGFEPDTSEFAPADLSKAENAVIKFMTWWDMQGFAVIESETQIVSHDGYGGTLDIIARDREGKICLVDLKTSKGIYDEYWTQVAAYGKLWNENQLDSIDRYIICRIGKEAEDADFEIQERTNLDQHVEFFSHLLKAYQTRPRPTKKQIHA